MLIHASCVEYNGNGILISGPSGSGKSDLSLRLIMSGAILIADDIVNVDKNNIASCPKKLEGLLEVRGVGILKFKSKKRTKISLKLNLCSSHKDIKRFPNQEQTNEEVDFYPFDISAVEKIKLLLEIISSERKLIF
ncbi:MAG: HPr kinase/phosphatase C-terminal domain-containing protein [Alphaproteobacteria bacterium]|nr:HPr kinase/phosphatase C-terminal domain-containing protein [Alphaproteobacteria bacterium]